MFNIQAINLAEIPGRKAKGETIGYPVFFLLPLKAYRVFFWEDISKESLVTRWRVCIPI